MILKKCQLSETILPIIYDFELSIKEEKEEEKKILCTCFFRVYRYKFYKKIILTIMFLQLNVKILQIFV